MSYQTMFQAIALTACCLLVSCKKELNSKVELIEAVNLLSEQKYGPQRVSVTLPRGSYQVTTEVAEDQITLVFGSASNQKFVFKLPKGKKFPDSYGNLTLSPSESLQLLGLNIDVDTERDESAPTRSTESCTFSRQREICSYDHGEHNQGGRERDGHGRGEHGRGRGHQQCRTETITETGVQEVEYSYVSHSTHYEGQFLSVDHRLVGTLTASDYDSDKVYSYRGPCQIGGY